MLRARTEVVAVSSADYGARNCQYESTEDASSTPVTIIGDQDGVCDKAAWRTEAFYGHPLTGFTWP